MFKLFNVKATVGQGMLHYPEWSFVCNGLRKNLGTVIKFARRNPMAVQSDHFLVKLLQTLTIPQSQSLERYYSNVDAVSLNISMVLKMTSSYFRGQIFPGVFYGPGNSEILIAIDESFDYVDADRNWRTLAPVRVLRHPRSDLGLNIPDGTQTGSETGLVVVTINIPMLAVQYRAFRFNEVYSTNDDTGAQQSVMQFVRMYVLPNMLESHLDYAIFNRFDNLLKGAPMGESRRQHTFYLTDYSARVQAAQTILLNQLKIVSMDFSGILQSILTPTYYSLAKALVLPDIALTRQVIWALAAARLPALSFLIRVAHNGAGQRSQSEVNQVLKDALAYKSDSLLVSSLPRNLVYEIQSDIDDIVANV